MSGKLMPLVNTFMKVISDSHHELTTQMYFEGDPLNQHDRILQGMNNSQKDGVTVSFKENQSKILEGEFTIALMGR